MNSQAKAWALSLFQKSPLKQRKLEKITLMIGKDYSGKVCLDIGSDNGVISLLLRERGGEWHSADISEETVLSIQSLVEDRVYKIDDRSTPFVDNQFDLVVIVDFLEHIESDQEFIKEMYRIIKPNGNLVINVPNPKEGILRKLKNYIGQTDKAHGHLRAGYTQSTLCKLLENFFQIQETHSYSRIFSELIDTLITGALDILKGKRGQKGTVITGQDLNKMQKSFKIYSYLSPIIFFFVKLDALVPFMHGNMLIVKAKRL